MAAVALHLADTSALSRLNHPAVDAALSPLIESGQVAICGMVELEVLFSARRPADYLRRQRQLRDGFEELAMPHEVWQRAMQVQAALAERSQHRGAALPNLLIAATAERPGSRGLKRARLLDSGCVTVPPRQRPMPSPVANLVATGAAGRKGVNHDQQLLRVDKRTLRDPPTRHTPRRGQPARHPLPAGSAVTCH